MTNILEDLRKEKGLRRDVVAKDLGITLSYYGMLETSTRKPSLPIAIKIAKYYGKPVEQIFCCNN